MESVEYHGAVALLAWQIELGADESICDSPVDRYALPDRLAKPEASASAAQVPAAKGPSKAARPVPAPVQEVDAVAVARASAAGAGDLAALQAAVAGFELCELKRGARNMIFADGDPAARVMIVSEAPTKDEDRTGQLFAGTAGVLLDRMFEAIGMSRAAASLYATSVLPWRPPQDRDPRPEDLAMMKPFLERHIALAKPDVLVLMGNSACHALLGKRGITRLRGTWAEACGVPAMPMFHPRYLMNNPLAKREAWADLLSVKARLNDD